MMERKLKESGHKCLDKGNVRIAGIKDGLTRCVLQIKLFKSVEKIRGYNDLQDDDVGVRVYDHRVHLASY